MCKVGDYVIDSTGVYTDFKNTSWGSHTGKEVGKEEVIKNWLSETGVWNLTFDQGDLPEIYEKIKSITI